MIDEEVRRRLHEELDAEPTPTYLLSRMMSSIPATGRRAPRPRPSLVWARSWVAALLALAVVAGLIYIGRGLGPVLVHKSPHRPVTPAYLAAPNEMAIGPDGSLYFSDYLSAYVFRRLPDGSLVTVAGARPDASIDQGDAGNGGPAVDAPLFAPAGLAFDLAGNLYIADSAAHRVRRIDRHGVITTVAGTGPAVAAMGAFGGDGGPATAARLNGPIGIAFDSSGVLYIADFLNGRIRLVDTSGRISSLDQSTLPMAPADFRPAALAFDAGGNLYVISGDTGFLPTGRGCEILRRSADGAWSTVAGTGVCGFSGDGGPATAAQISSADSPVFDSAGNLYFSDFLNHRIRRVDGKGVITTVAGTGVYGYSGDGGAGVKAEMQYPAGMVMARGDVLYVAEDADTSIATTNPGRIRVLRISDGTITTIVNDKTVIHTSG